MAVLTAGAAEIKTLKHVTKTLRNLGNHTHPLQRGKALYWISFYFNSKQTMFYKEGVSSKGKIYHDTTHFLRLESCLHDKFA